MLIKVYIPAALIQMKEEIEVELFIGSRQHFNVEDCLIPVGFEEIADMTDIEVIIIEAFRKIFEDEEHKEREYQDFDGRCYTRPQDIREVIIEEGLAPKFDLTSARIGRTLQRLGFKSNDRKNTGIPYFWDENKEVVERLLSLNKEMEN